MQVIDIKQGDTFNLTCTRVDADGVPEDISGYTITASYQTANGDVTGSFTVGAGVGTGEFTLSADATTTSSWPIYRSVDGTLNKRNILYCDVQFVIASVVETSETFAIYVHMDVT